MPYTAVHCSSSEVCFNEYNTVVVVVVIDSHIQRIVLATEETTVTQQPTRDHKEVPRSTGHIVVTTRYLDQNRDPNRDETLYGSASNCTDQYQNGSSNLLSPYREHPRSTRIVVAYIHMIFM